MPSTPIAYHTYQSLAEAYSQIAPDKEYNAYYDRPAMLSLLDKDLAGQHILDAGCGPGIYSEILLKKGADVTGVDISENMIQHAQTRNGDQGRFIVGNMEQPLSMFQDQQFDGVLSALAISYIKDISTLFGEFQRILKPGACFAFPPNTLSFRTATSNWKIILKPKRFLANGKALPMSPSPCTVITTASAVLPMLCWTMLLSLSGFWRQNLWPNLAKHPRAYAERLKFPSFIHFRARKA